MDTTDTGRRSLVVAARRWFDRTYGNSYYTARVIVDGETVAYLPFGYGHGEALYLGEAVKAARAAGVSGLPEGGRYSGSVDWHDLKRAGWTSTVDVAEVERKRDLHAIPDAGTLAEMTRAAVARIEPATV